MLKQAKRMILYPRDGWFEWNMFWKDHWLTVASVVACLVLAAPCVMFLWNFVIVKFTGWNAIGYFLSLLISIICITIIYISVAWGALSRVQ